jgi:hypothetical protein
MFLPFNAKNSNSTNWNQVNNLAKDVAGKERVQIYKDDTGTRRVLIGKGKNGFYGVKTTPEGVDVYEAEDSDLTFNSNNNVFKVVDTTTLTLTRPASTNYTTVSYTHNLGFIPAMQAYVYTDTTYYPLPYTDINISGGAGTDYGKVRQHISISSNSTTTTIAIKTPSNAWNALDAVDQDFSFKIYLLQETAN